MATQNDPNQRPAPEKTIAEIAQMDPEELRQYILNTPYNDGTYPKSREEWLKEEQEENDDE